MPGFVWVPISCDSETGREKPQASRCISHPPHSTLRSTVNVLKRMPYGIKIRGIKIRADGWPAKSVTDLDFRTFSTRDHRALDWVALRLSTEIDNGGQLGVTVVFYPTTTLNFVRPTGQPHDVGTKQWTWWQQIPQLDMCHHHDQDHDHQQHTRPNQVSDDSIGHSHPPTWFNFVTSLKLHPATQRCYPRAN